jgi:hypothetical protein
MTTIKKIIKKIKDSYFLRVILFCYTIIYLIGIQLFAIHLFVKNEVIEGMPIADIVGIYLLGILGYLLSNLCFLIPFAFVMVGSIIVNFIGSIAWLAWIVLHIFSAFGSTVEIPDSPYGFFITLIILILITPICIGNLIISFKFID